MMISRRNFLSHAAAVAAVAPLVATNALGEVSDKADSFPLEKMNLLILGSCASEGCPSPYCTCDLCQSARALGGKDVRLRAGYQLGETIRIDWSPDALAQSNKFNLKPALLRHIFITHSHEDHLFPMDFWTRGITMKNDGAIARVYGNKQVLEAIGKAIGNNWKQHRLEPVTLTPGMCVEISEHKMQVKALLANHMKNEEALLYLFCTPQWKLFIACDTDYFPETTWGLLKNEKIDVMVIDSTWGMVRRNEGHLGVPNVVEIVERMKKEGALQNNAKVIPSHLSHHGALAHEEMEAKLATLGMEPAFDGKLVELPINRQ